jgi:Hint domain
MAIMERATLGAAPGSGRNARGRQSFDLSAACMTGAEDRFHLALILGTRVATPRAEVAVEAIAPGDAILTRKAGAQPVSAVTIRTLPRETLIMAHRLTPVLVRAGALGAGLPHTDLCLHPWTQLCTVALPGGDAVLRATDLIGSGQVMRIFPDRVTYIDLALDVAAEVLVSGVWLASAKGGAPPQTTTGRGWCRIGDITPDWTPQGETATA